MHQRLLIKLTCKPDHIDVDVDTGRKSVAHLLLGRSPEQASALVPLMFSLCANAQKAAADAALMAAQGNLLTSQQCDVWGFAVKREVILEHLWRLMLDWPECCGAKRFQQHYAKWRKQLLACEDMATLSRVFQPMLQKLMGAKRIERKRVFARGMLKDVFAYVQAMPPAHAKLQFLPKLHAQTWLARVNEINTPAFVARPVLDGEAYETGPLARQHAHPSVAPLVAQQRYIEARLVARLVELQSLTTATANAQQDWITVAHDGLGGGISCVETARGLLMHYAQVSTGMVQQYAIVAPTEWNFHPKGSFMREVRYCSAYHHDDLLAFAKAVALSLDPCIKFEVIVYYA